MNGICAASEELEAKRGQQRLSVDESSSVFFCSSLNHLRFDQHDRKHVVNALSAITLALIRIALLTTILACQFHIEENEQEPFAVVQASITNNLATPGIPVRPHVVVDFSDSVDPKRAHPGSVAIIAWTENGECERSCEEGLCVSGRCWTDPLSAGRLRNFGKGNNSEGETLTIELQEGSYGPNSRLILRPDRVLLPYQLYELVLGTALGSVDQALLPLSANQKDVGLRRKFMTESSGSSGPELALIVPSVGLENVPTNLRLIRTNFSRPIQETKSDTITLISERNESMILTEPQSCPGMDRTNCLQWPVEVPLQANTSYKIISGSVQGIDGQSMQIERDLQWFHTASAPAGPLPDRESMHLWQRGRCIYAGIHAEEPILLNLQVHNDVARALAPLGGSVAIPIPPSLSNQEQFLVQVGMQNLAGMAKDWTWNLSKHPSFANDLPQLAITEVLSNPIGIDGQGEFVEIIRLPDSSGSRRNGNDGPFSGIYLSDQSWEIVEQALREGTRLGDLLPEFRLKVDQILVVVGAGYVNRNIGSGQDRTQLGRWDVNSELDLDLDPDLDPDLVPDLDPVLDQQGQRLGVEDAVWIRLDSSLGSGGLANRGEALTLYRANPPALLASVSEAASGRYGGQEGQSMTIINPQGCDWMANWQFHPEQSSDPGRLSSQ